ARADARVHRVALVDLPRERPGALGQLLDDAEGQLAEALAADLAERVDHLERELLLLLGVEPVLQQLDLDDRHPLLLSWGAASLVSARGSRRRRAARRR